MVVNSQHIMNALLLNRPDGRIEPDMTHIQRNLNEVLSHDPVVFIVATVVVGVVALMWWVVGQLFMVSAL